jgi:hypothetical protein
MSKGGLPAICAMGCRNAECGNAFVLPQTNKSGTPVVWLHTNTSTPPRVLFASFFHKQNKKQKRHLHVCETKWASCTATIRRSCVYIGPMPMTGEGGT